MVPKVLLVADDSSSLRAYVRAAVESEDVVLLPASDGEEAVALAQERAPDGIVLDLFMPRLDGLSALVKLRSDPRTKHIPVMMVSGAPSLEAEDLARAYGASCFLAKPFTARALVSQVRNLLGLVPSEAL